MNINNSVSVISSGKYDEDLSPISFEDALTKTGNGTYNYSLVLVCGVILLGIGADLMGFSVIVAAACDLDVTVGQKGVLTSLPFIGILLASYWWGYVSDTRGRRFTLMLSMQAGFWLSCISSLAPNWLVLAVVKFVSVSFSCGANSATYTIVGESCGRRVRNKCMLLMTSLLLFSPGFAAIIAYPVLKLQLATPISMLGIVFRPWRLLCIVIAIPSGLGALGIYFCYESPKFLANSGKAKEALEVLSKIYSINMKTSPENYKIPAIQPPDPIVRDKEESLLNRIWEQSAPLFRPPLLKKSLQLYYIVAVVYITNNSFLIWLPHIIQEAMHALTTEGGKYGNLCKIISYPDPAAAVVNDNVTVATNFTADITSTPQCTAVNDNLLFTLFGSQTVFCFLAFLLSQLPNKRKAVLISIMALSGTSGLLINVTPEPVSSVIFFVIFTCPCLAMGILASYFVDFYPTSYRGMATCLSIMVGRTSAFVGINLVGQTLFTHCSHTFYLWALLVFTAVITAWFLPPDKPKETEVLVTKL